MALLRVVLLGTFLRVSVKSVFFKAIRLPKIRHISASLEQSVTFYNYSSL